MSARSIRRSREREEQRRGRKRSRRAGIAIGATAAVAAAVAPGADAANFTVTNLNNAGGGSLRNAIASANGAAGADSITFTGAGASGEIRLTTDEIAITDDLTITGPGAAQLSISGDVNNDGLPTFATSAVALGDSRIFNISDATSPGSPLENVTITGLTLKEAVGDDFTATPNSVDGGAIYANQVALNLSNDTFSNNVATDNGGGLYLSGGKLTISGSTFTGNRAKSQAGAIGSSTDKYGPREEPATQIVNSQIVGNTAGGTNFGAFGNDSSPDGGGIFNKYGGASISGSTIAGNTALTNIAGNINGNGGGVNLGSFSKVIDSTISGNTAGDEGGGGYLFGARLLRSTVTGNTVVDGAGGGVYAGLGKYGGGAARIDDSTISGNNAVGTDVYSGTGGGLATYSSSTGVLVRNSTIASNTATNKAGGVAAYAFGDEPGIELQSSIVGDNLAAGAASDTQSFTLSGNDLVDGPGGISAGFSLVETPKSTLEGAPAGSNITGVDAQLQPLASNGGPTQTQALALTSPAIDSAQANGFATDQAGQARTVDATATNAPLSDGTDMGAFEVQNAAATGGDPDTAFDKKPPKKVKLKGGTGKVKLKFSGTDNSGAPGPLTFECKVDKGKFEECTSPLKLKLDKGKHVIEVRAIDSDGRVDSTPAKAKIKVAKKKPKK